MRKADALLELLRGDFITHPKIYPRWLEFDKKQSKLCEYKNGKVIKFFPLAGVDGFDTRYPLDDGWELYACKFKNSEFEPLNMLMQEYIEHTVAQFNKMRDLEELLHPYFSTKIKILCNDFVSKNVQPEFDIIVGCDGVEMCIPFTEFVGNISKDPEFYKNCHTTFTFRRNIHRELFKNFEAFRCQKVKSDLVGDGYIIKKDSTIKVTFDNGETLVRRLGEFTKEQVQSIMEHAQIFKVSGINVKQY